LERGEPRQAHFSNPWKNGTTTFQGLEKAALKRKGMTNVRREKFLDQMLDCISDSVKTAI